MFDSLFLPMDSLKQKKKKTCGRLGIWVNSNFSIDPNTSSIWHQSHHSLVLSKKILSHVLACYLYMILHYFSAALNSLSLIISIYIFSRVYNEVSQLITQKTEEEIKMPKRRDSLKPGDHIYSDRCRSVYFHHGIVFFYSWIN